MNEENKVVNDTEQATEANTEQTTQQTQTQGTEQANPNPTPQPKKGVAERVLGGVGKLLDKAVPIVIGAVVVGGCAYVKGRHDGKEATLRKAARKVEVPPVREQEHVEQQTTEQTDQTQRRPIGFDSYGNPIG